MKQNNEKPLSVTTTSSTNQKAAISFNITSESPTVLPPSKYWIGDLSYVMESRWGDFCEEMQTANGDDHNGEIEIDGLKLWYHTTEYGDGCYTALKNTLPNSQIPEGGFFVDSGLIGIMPFELTDSSSADYSSGVTVSLAEAVTCSYKDGLFRFKSGRGELLIDPVPEGLTGIMSAFAKLS